MENEKHIAPKLAIATIMGGVALYDALCERGDTISEETSRLRATKFGRFLVPFMVTTTALHLLEAIPKKWDWIHRLAELKQKSSD